MSNSIFLIRYLNHLPIIFKKLNNFAMRNSFMSIFLSLASFAFILASSTRFLQIQTKKTPKVQLYESLVRQINGAHISAMNLQKESTFKLAHNQFSELTWDQFKSTYLNLQPNTDFIYSNITVSKPLAQKQKNLRSSQTQTGRSLFQATLSTSTTIVFTPGTNVSWVSASGLVNVEFQGTCDGSYAFSLAGHISYLYKLRNVASLILSKQQIIDCSIQFGNNGCFGGSVINSFKYVFTAGITTQIQYPYVGSTEDCEADAQTTDTQSYAINSYSAVAQGSCESVLRALAYRPLIVSIYIGQTLRFYSSGVLSTCDANGPPNFAAQLIGYYQDNIQSYYTIQLSFGVSWGQGGFARLSATAASGNLCQICSAAFYAS